MPATKTSNIIGIRIIFTQMGAIVCRETLSLTMGGEELELAESEDD